MKNISSRIAGKCPHYESIRAPGGIEMGPVLTRELLPRCEYCLYWLGGNCQLFGAKGGHASS